MSKLTANEAYILNTLIDRNVFTSRSDENATVLQTAAINALKRPQVQQKLNHYLRELLGIPLQNVHENLVLLLGPKPLPAPAVHVLLATIKAVITDPGLASETEHTVSQTTLLRAIASEVSELSLTEILRWVNALFVERLALFKINHPVAADVDQAGFVNDYWDVDPHFLEIAAALVTELREQAERIKPKRLQQINLALLQRQYIGSNDPLWPDIRLNREKLAAMWADWGRFTLEVGDQYALLLDNTRARSAAKPYLVALATAQQLGSGVPQDQLMAVIKHTAQTLVPDSNVNFSQVKQALYEEGFATDRDGFVHATPLHYRFQVQPEEEKHE